jgi:hypothetical protein
MKRKKVWQYQCEFCGRKKYSAPHMAHHEKQCTMNIKRKCGMCRISDNVQTDIYKLIEFCRKHSELKLDGNFGAYPKESEEKKFIDSLKDLANECPACILSALRLSDTFLYHHLFDFKKERESFFDELNENRSQECGY